MSEVQTRLPDSEALMELLTRGDLSKLTKQQQQDLVLAFCRDFKLSPYNNPVGLYNFDGGKTVFYITKAGTDQIRTTKNISVTSAKTEIIGDDCIVTATAKDLNTGREDTDIGTVSLLNLKGQQRMNAMMKAMTKAKRRVTLSLCGLGQLDESEVDDANGRKIPVEFPQGKPAQLANEESMESLKIRLMGMIKTCKDKRLGEQSVLALERAEGYAQLKQLEEWLTNKLKGENNGTH